MTQSSELSRQIVIGVFGISGVGKTTLISQFVETHDGYAHLQASKLIKENLANSALSSEHLRTLGATTIKLNQFRLVDEFNIARQTYPGQTLLLDAHSVIDSDPQFIVPVEIISGLGLVQIIFVRDDPASIAKRRQQDEGRRRPIREVERIAVLQDLALNQCQKYASDLCIPLNLISAGDVPGLLIAAQLCVRRSI